MFSPMSSGRDSWQDEPASIKPGRFRAHHSSNQSNLNTGSTASTSSPNNPNPNLNLSSNSSNHSAAPPSRQQPFYSHFWSSNDNSSNDPIHNHHRNHPHSKPKAINSNSFAPSFAPEAARRKERLGRTRMDSLGGTSGSGFRRNGQPKKRSWALNLFRPRREVVEILLESWWKRWGVLAVAPSLLVWFWCAVPFPKSDPYDNSPPWCGPPLDNSPSNPPWCGSDPQAGASSTTLYSNDSLIFASQPNLEASSSSTESLSLIGLVFAFLNKLLEVGGNLPLALRSGSNSFLSTSTEVGKHPTVDANFWFFLIFYYGIYCAVALVYITQLFSLYRLNWWPAALGAKTSYAAFWLLSLCAGYGLHVLDPLGSEASNGKKSRMNGSQESDPDDIQWQRKTLWVGLAFATMSMPALVCLAGLRRSGRQNYRHSLTEAQKTFLERQLARRIPASYIRFLWFISTIGMALFALIAGQGYASVYLSTLPHTGLDGTAYVTFWMTTVNVLAVATHWILEEKVKSRALLFVFKYYYFLVYFIFYRNLFARLQSLDQFAFVQLLSSFWVCIWYPFSMTSVCHRITQYFNPEPKSWEEYVESVGLAFYLRNLAQNTSMLAFLGWVSILHFGPNQHLYPFFAFDDKRDPYNYQLTMLGSLAIWGSELFSSYIARELCKFAFQVDVTNLGLDEMREYPEIVPTCVWTSIHVLMDMLLFLIKLNFQ